MSREASGGGLALREIWGADPAVSSAGAGLGLPPLPLEGPGWLSSGSGRILPAVISRAEVRSWVCGRFDSVECAVSHSCRQWVLRP